MFVRKKLIIPFVVICFIFSSFFASAESVDSHFHVFSSQNFKNSIGSELILDLLNEGAIDKAIILSAGYMFEDYEKAKIENDFTAAQVKIGNNRLLISS